MLSGIDKVNWKSVTLDDVVIRREENDKEHAKERFERFIKVEHMDAESLHLKRWGIHAEEELPPTFYKIFRHGQILFPTRNPHLRRTALAHFDGICGEKTLTLEPNSETVDRSFLPFLFNSESFVAHTTSSIIGSTNPHVRWRDVAKYEFLLPPKDQQARLAELLWAADEVVETKTNFLSHLRNLLLGIEAALFVESDGGKLKSVVINSFSGGTPDTKRKDYYSGGTIPWVTTKIMGGDFISIGEKLITQTALENSATKLLPAGNLIAGIRVGVGKFSINKIPMAFSQDVTGIIVDKKKVDLEFLVYQLNSSVIQNKIKPLLRGTTIKGITKDSLMNLPILVPPFRGQIQMRDKIRSIRAAITYAENDIINLNQLQKSLINQIF